MAQQKQHRNTPQRRVVLEELQKVTSHPTAVEVYEMVRGRMPKIYLLNQTRIGKQFKVPVNRSQTDLRHLPTDHFVHFNGRGVRGCFLQFFQDRTALWRISMLFLLRHYRLLELLDSITNSRKVKPSDGFLEQLPQVIQKSY